MSLFAAIIPLIAKAFDLIPDPAQRAQQLQTVIGALQDWDKQQTEVNKIEAASSSLFVSGWRPFIGWVCGMALAYTYIVVPIATWICAYYLINIPGFPSLDDKLWELTFGMLGMGGLRTFEKVKGVAR